jgi:hypothetical protein
VVENLQIAGGRLSLRILRDGSSVLLEITENPDDLDILIHPSTREHHRIAHSVPRHEPALTQ